LEPRISRALPWLLLLLLLLDMSWKRFAPLPSCCPAANKLLPGSSQSLLLPASLALPSLSILLALPLLLLLLLLLVLLL
jgi:hypothetical protein